MEPSGSDQGCRRVFTRLKHATSAAGCDFATEPPRRPAVSEFTDGGAQQ